jgi:hypothetical protein
MIRRDNGGVTLDLTELTPVDRAAVVFFGVIVEMLLNRPGFIQEWIATVQSR